MGRKTNALLSSLFLAFIVLSFDGYYDYASGQDKLEVFTDKQIYNLGDTVIIFGTVPALTAATPNEPVTIELLEPTNVMHPIGQLIPQDGRYKLEFQLVGELANDGTWTVKAIYAGQEAFTSFVVVPEGSIETGYPFTVETDKSSYLGNDIIRVSGTVPFVAEGHVVTVSVLDPTNTVYITRELPPNSDGTYNFDFVIESRLPMEGIYTVQAIYNEQPAKTVFSYAAGISARITIDSVSLDRVRWDLDSVTVNGSVMDVSEGYTVTVNWGDGTSTTGIPISDNVWVPISHVYDSSSVGNNRITAELISNDPPSEVLAASKPYLVNVLKHRTSLTLDPVDYVLTDSSFTVSGRLYDTDAERGISDKKIIVRGSTTDQVVTTGALTDSNGYYKSSGSLSGDLPADKLLFYANFVGDDLYFTSSSYVQFVGDELYLADDSDMRTITMGEESPNVEQSTGGSEISAVLVIPPIVATAATITLMNVPKPRPKPKIRKDASTVITLQAEVDIKRE